MEKIKNKRQFTGVVVGAKEQKTIRVLVRSTKVSAKYRKHYNQLTKYPVHDEKSAAKVGDLVLFAECRPLSRGKRWRLLKVLKTNLN